MKPPKIKPPVINFFIIVLTLILHFNIPIKKMINYPYNLIGIVVLLFGLYIALQGKRTFDRLGTSVMFRKPTKLSTGGLFKHTRNPMYLGVTISLLGISILLGSLISFIAPILFFLIINIFFIPFEERWLTELFGKDYLQYKKKVRRWI